MNGRFSKRASRSIVVVIALLSSLLAATAIAQYRVKNVPRAEVLKLPKFCWSRYIEELQTPEFQMPGGCGPAMNHYCDGLLNLANARRNVSNPAQRARDLGLARSATLYTLNGMERYPACPIRGHVEGTLAQIDAMLKGLPKSGR